MALQKTVGLVPEIGKDGQEVVIGQAEYLTYNPLSDGTATAGKFCFNKADSGDGIEFGHASLSASASAYPLGLVEAVADATIASMASEYQSVYPEGAALTVAVKGQYYITAPSACTNGQKVFVAFASGNIVIGDTAGEGQVDTGWTVRVPNGKASASAGDIIIVEKY
jgi:hypothetical protein